MLLLMSMLFTLHFTDNYCECLYSDLLPLHTAYHRVRSDLAVASQNWWFWGYWFHLTNRYMGDFYQQQRLFAATLLFGFSGLSFLSLWGNLSKILGLEN
jgi:hypothetical protein